MTQVFLSHSTVDADIALKIATSLRAAEIPVWKAPESIKDGEEWVSAIERGLVTSTHLILLQSQAAVDSEWVKFEFNVALSQQKQGKIKIVPIEYQPCNLPLFWSHFQQISGINDDYDTTLLRIITQLRNDQPAYPPEPTSLETTINVIIEDDIRDSLRPVGGDITYLGQPSVPHTQTIGLKSVRTLPLLYGLGWLLLIVLIGSILVAIGVFDLGTATIPQAAIIPQAEIIPSDTPSPMPTATNSPSPSPTTTPSESEMARILAINGVTANGDWEPYIENINGIEMALVPSGCFQMGSNNENDEQPIHKVCFDNPFWIDVYEVSNSQYGNTSPDCLDLSFDINQPKVCLSWEISQKYCNDHDARLPTEAEWEYAARGPDNLIYPWGDTFLAGVVTYSENSGEQAAQVNSHLDGVSWIGAYNLSGNVWEWVSDWYSDSYYTVLSDGVVNPQGPQSGDYRVVRGGSWGYSEEFLRAANRGWSVSSAEVGGYGIRCARDYE